MRDMMVIVFVIFLAVSMPVFAIIFAPKLIGRRLKPLLSFIEGRIYGKYRGVIIAILEGIWQGEKVKVELKHYRYGEDVFITLFSSRPWPFSLKVRPSSRFFSFAFVSLDGLRDGHSFEIPEAGLTVYSHAGDETKIRQLLNPARLAIIQDIFSQKLNCLEIHSDPITGGYLKAGVEYRHCPGLFDDVKASNGAIKPETVRRILEQLREFSNADKSGTTIKHEYSESVR